MSRRQMMLSIIIPVYNEELTIGNIIDRTKVAAQKIGLPFEIIVVNDLSYDHSLEVALQRKVRVFTLKEHLGQRLCACGRGLLKSEAT